MRCFIQPSDWNRPEIELDREETHHLVRVLRATIGDRVAVFNGAGETGTAEVIETRKAAVILRMLTRQTEPLDHVSLVLAQALLREQKMDFVIQKAVELGAAALQPLLTERCVAHLRSGQTGDKCARWEKIALAAAKQCGTARLPAILPPLSITDYLTPDTLSHPILVGALTGNAPPFSRVLQQVLSDNPRRITIMVGPEGDFSPAEMSAILEAGVHPVTFGHLVLRAETAALFALSILRYETLLPG